MFRHLEIAICDDEKSGLKVLDYELKQLGITKLNYFSSPFELLDNLDFINPDGILLDIEMPSLDGIEVAKRLKNHPAQVVFVTAHPNYALKSYDVEALDFLTKPIKPGHLDRSMRRLLKYASSRLSIRTKKRSYTISVKDGSTNHLLRNNDIISFEAQDKYVLISTVTRTYLWRQSMQQLLKLLHDDFIQIHRSTIINTTFLKAVDWSKGGCVVLTQGGNQYTVSKSYKTNVKKLVSN